MSVRPRQLLGAAAAAILVIGSTSQLAEATIATTSGNIALIAAPPSTLPEALEHATDVFAFNEQQGVTLASPLETDFQSPGTYDDACRSHRRIVARGDRGGQPPDPQRPSGFEPRRPGR